MLVESLAILMIFAVMAFLFLRAHRKDYAAAIAPLMIVPLVHALAGVLGEFFRFATHTNFRAFADVIALTAAVAIMGMLCTSLKSRKAKYAYLLLCGGFSLALTLIFLYNIYLPG